MSSIIDALKKSDAKRPRKNHGQKIRMDINQQPRKNNRRDFYLIIACLLLILAAVYFQKPEFVWQHLGSAQQVSVEPADQVVKQETTKPIPVSKPPQKLPKPAPERVQSVVEKQSTQPVSDKQTDANNRTTAQKTEPTIVHSEENSLAMQVDNSTAQKPSQSEQTDPAVKQIDQQLAATPMKNKQAIEAPPQTDSHNQSADADLPQLFELPYAVRKDIPQLNLSVHVYDPDVDNRMAIINGVPIHVGDTIEDVLSIQDITQSGVVLRIQDQEFIVLK